MHFFQVGRILNLTMEQVDIPPPTLPTWKNDVFDDGSGTLAAMRTGAYGCLWIYYNVQAQRIEIVYGSQQYDHLIVTLQVFYVYENSVII